MLYLTYNCIFILQIYIMKVLTEILQRLMPDSGEANVKLVLKPLLEAYEKLFEKPSSIEAKIKFLKDLTGPENESYQLSVCLFFIIDQNIRHTLFKAQYDNLRNNEKLYLGKKGGKRLISEAAIIRTLVSTLETDNLQRSIGKFAKDNYPLQYGDLKRYLKELKEETMEQQQKKLTNTTVEDVQKRETTHSVDIRLTHRYYDRDYPGNQAYLDALTSISQGTLHALATFKLWEQLEKFTTNSISLDNVAKEYICQLRNVDQKVQNVNAFFDNFATSTDEMKHKESINENRGFVCSKSARAARGFQPFSGNNSKLRIFQTAEKGNDRSKIVVHPKGSINALSAGK